MNHSLASLLGIRHPIIVAPMFLISNEDMIVAALESGATAAFPALNYRSLDDLKAAIENIRSRSKEPFGVNLIVNKSNPRYQAQLEILLEMKVDYIITSLGNPEETIRKAKPKGIKVFCDVTDAAYAKKVESLGADAVIAVNKRAGGHCGNLSEKELIDSIRTISSIPIISAGGIGNASHIRQSLQYGAIGVSVGTVFLASEEAKISDEYRQALIDYSERDVVLTTKISGSHLTVINTPYVKEMGTDASAFEKLLLRNKWLKKYAKMIVAYLGMKKVEYAAQKPTYKTVWCAGPSIEYIHQIRPLKEIMRDLIG